MLYNGSEDQVSRPVVSGENKLVRSGVIIRAQFGPIFENIGLDASQDTAAGEV